MPRRSTLDAAARIQAHCQHVRGLCTPDRRSVREARDGPARPAKEAGWIQLSFDSNSAFDLLEWTQLSDDMEDTQVNGEHLREAWASARMSHSRFAMVPSGR